MRKNRTLKIKYKYNRPRTPEEKKKQQEILDGAYDILFRSVVERKIKEL